MEWYELTKKKYNLHGNGALQSSQAWFFHSYSEKNSLVLIAILFCNHNFKHTKWIYFTLPIQLQGQIKGLEGI